MVEDIFFWLQFSALVWLHLLLFILIIAGIILITLFGRIKKLIKQAEEFLQNTQEKGNDIAVVVMDTLTNLNGVSDGLAGISNILAPFRFLNFGEKPNRATKFFGFFRKK